MKVERLESEQILKGIRPKVCPMEQIAQVASGKCILTKGVFDIPHYGHMSLFSYLGQLKIDHQLKLIVCVTSDRVVKIKKGESRPINPEKDRALFMACLPQVDFVCIYDEEDYSLAISTLKPTFYIKGMDTTGKDMEVERLIEKNPEFKAMPTTSQVIIYSDDGSISTSDIINRIKTA